jgi:hypothetical protein
LLLAETLAPVDLNLKPLRKFEAHPVAANTALGFVDRRNARYTAIGFVATRRAQASAEGEKKKSQSVNAPLHRYQRFLTAR